MASNGRDTGTDTALRDQDVLKAFDFEASDDRPFLTVADVQAALTKHWDIQRDITTVHSKLDGMIEDGLVARRTISGVHVYCALVGPRLADDVRPESNAALGETVPYEVFGRLSTDDGE